VIREMAGRRPSIRLIFGRAPGVLALTPVNPLLRAAKRDALPPTGRSGTPTPQC
jgi:hypothetical protein